MFLEKWTICDEFFKSLPTVTAAFFCPNEPACNPTATEFSGFFLVTILTAPVNAFCPNTLAAGPFMISIRSITSNGKAKFMVWWPVCASSTLIPSISNKVWSKPPPRMYKSACIPAVPRRLISIPANCCSKSAMFVAALCAISSEVITVMVLEFSLKGKSILLDVISTSFNCSLMVSCCLTCSFWELTMIEANMAKAKK